VIVIKGSLMLLSGLMAAGMLFAQNQSLLTGFLLGCVIFGFCRFYYFLFYVIQNYVDPDFRYSGVFDALKHLFRKKDQNFRNLS
jgi:hypothetical protein